MKDKFISNVNHLSNKDEDVFTVKKKETKQPRYMTRERKGDYSEYSYDAYDSREIKKWFVAR